MRIVTFARIQEFSKQHPSSDIALRTWYVKTQNSNWTHFNDIKNTFNNVDIVGNSRFVFNIRENDFRLVAIVIFASQKVYFRFIGTHAEYENRSFNYLI